MEQEYRGQKVIDTFGARLIPPNDSYPDCECLIVLTAQHLYVLEDNYDGTYETYFEFVLREVDDIRMQQDSSDNGAVSMASLLITGILGALVGSLPTGENQKKVKKNFLVISYHEPQGEKHNIYFDVSQPGAKGFIQQFHKAKEL